MRNIQNIRNQIIEKKTGIFQKQKCVANNKKRTVEYFRLLKNERLENVILTGNI